MKTRAVRQPLLSVDYPYGSAKAAAAVRALASSREARGLNRIDLAVRDWARRDKAVARRLRRVDNRRMEYMRSLFGVFRA